MIRGLFVRLAWLLAAAGIALGAAGLAAGLDHPAGAGGRGELTLGADAAITPGLDAATRELARLADEVGTVGDLGRAALTALVARKPDELAAAIDAGSRAIETVQAHAAALRARLDALPGIGPGMSGRLSAEVLARRATLLGALPVVDGLDEAWIRLASAAVPATELTNHLLAHDRIAGDAVQAGSSGRYAKALETLARAEAELAAANSIRDRLAATVDVTTLDEWLKRNATYDAAVRALWQAMLESKGRVTDAARAAGVKVEAARKGLPPDARALVIILGDVARGGLNQAVVAVEEVRGPLSAAVEAASAPVPDASPGTGESGGAAGTTPPSPRASAAPAP